MFNLTLNGTDIEWLRSNYPDLTLNESEEEYAVIEGLLKFDMVFHGDGKPYVINPKEEHLKQGERIQDEYEIRIELKPSEHSNMPQVYETADRIKSVSLKKKSELMDLHINFSGSACICLNTKEKEFLPNGFNLADYFNNLVIPFFYAQSYFENTGKWPWGEYGHGVIGILESFLEYSATQENVEVMMVALKKFCKRNNLNFNFYKEQLRQKKIKGRNQCPCNSGKKWGKCHNKSLEGLRLLREHINTLAIKI